MAESTIKKDAPIIKRKGYSYKIGTVNAGAVVDVTANQLGMSTPTGYTALAVYNTYTSAAHVAVIGYRGTATGTTGAAVTVKNTHATAAASSVTVYLYVSYIRDDLWDSNIT